MRENRFGNRFFITTFGESHSKAIGVLIEGLKPNIEINIKDIQKLLNQRKPGKNRYSSKRKESDKLEILSGIFEGKTLGTPIVAIIYNRDSRTKDYSNIKDIFRPSHADFTFFNKYGIRDYRGGGRASARETASRVIAGAIAIDKLREKNIIIKSKIVQIGPFSDFEIENLKELESSFYDKLTDYLSNLDGDSIGGIVETKIYGVQVGLGDPIFEKIDANLAKAIISIPAAKGIEFGKGFEFAKKKGSEVNDQMNENGFITNNSGGVQGGITNGETIIFRTVFKPTPSISKKQITQDIDGKKREFLIKGRHDPVIVLRTIPIINSMSALVIYDSLLEKEVLEKEVLEKEVLEKDSLDNLRKKINSLDYSLFTILNQRFKIVKKIVEKKRKLNLKIENISVENELINNIIDMNFDNLDKNFIKNIYKLIFKRSKEIQKKLYNLKH